MPKYAQIYISFWDILRDESMPQLTAFSWTILQGFLIFEFMQHIVLRPRQVEMVDWFPGDAPINLTSTGAREFWWVKHT